MLNVSLPIANNYGWGICGLNLAYELASFGDIRVFDPNPNSPLKRYVPTDWNPQLPYVVDEPMLHAIQGPSMFPLNLLTWSRTRNVGLCFIEDPDLAGKYIEVANSYFDAFITGSKWCTNELKKRGFAPVDTALQGVDQSVFFKRDNPPSGDKFVIGSFGKFEYRKGIDIVIAAFKKLMVDYPDAHLLCGWGNLWPDTMDTMAQSKLIQYCKVAGDWKTRCKAIMMLNEIPSTRYTLLDIMPHEQMADVYRSVHVGLALSRYEAGNNLPACEMIACGVPVLASGGTGHLDVPAGHLGLLSGGALPNGGKEVSPDRVIGAVKQFREYGSRNIPPASLPTWTEMAGAVAKVMQRRNCR